MSDLARFILLAAMQWNYQQIACNFTVNKQCSSVCILPSPVLFVRSLVSFFQFSFRKEVDVRMCNISTNRHSSANIMLVIAIDQE